MDLELIIMTNITIIGPFAEKEENHATGATVKVRELTKTLKKMLPDHNIKTVDTNDWKLSPKFLSSIVAAYMQSSNIIFVISEDSLKKLSILNSLFKAKCTYHYAVLGTGVADNLDSSKKKFLTLIDHIYVETPTARNKLVAAGFTQTTEMKNFKNYKTELSDIVNVSHNFPIRLCMFSRIEKKKGFTNAISTINKLHLIKKEKIFELDIYGLIEKDYEKEFENILKAYDFVTYKGIADPGEAVDILKEYSYLLFPTEYYTEGIPGTILDSFASGLPVIASRWKYCDDLIPNECGYKFDLGNYNDLMNVLELVINNNPDINMRRACLEHSKEYVPEKAIIPLLLNIKK